MIILIRELDDKNFKRKLIINTGVIYLWQHPAKEKKTGNAKGVKHCQKEIIMFGDILKIIVETTGIYLSKKAGEAVKRAIDDRKKADRKKKK